MPEFVRKLEPPLFCEALALALETRAHTHSARTAQCVGTLSTLNATLTAAAHCVVLLHRCATVCVLL